ncbi:ester cyclase [Sphingomonas sp. S2-65]|uniref:ester cyclase n=1 Tax=Sphingomonas sp. S2-65 TaxID=2903960 RepID=UPI001F2656E7|nr:ester cyclase [Sphingomonas sp. S2-65]UYY58076.1 ester cyclase [Sphingomonas sp. S2-65]
MRRKTIGLVLGLLAAQTPAQAQTLSDTAAIAATQPRELVSSKDITDARRREILKPVEAFYGFWANGSEALIAAAISSDFVDHTLPPGRPQGPAGPMAASKAFLGAVPDLRVSVVQRLIVGDRVVSHLRFTGHFTGHFGDKAGTGQAVDFIATDIVRVRGGRITDNWHLEDNLTFLQQIGIVPR